LGQRAQKKEIMKKFFLAVLSCMLLLCGCSNDDDQSHYSEKQEKAFALFNGTWADTQFSNLGNYPGAELQPDPDKIIFGTHYQTPKEVTENSYMNGEAVLFDAQGECTYYSMPYKGAEYEIIKCLYNVSPKADILSLWSISENKSYHVYDMSIKSETQIYLYQSGITLPYIFAKQ
jgi:hypothetical protein